MSERRNELFVRASRSISSSRVVPVAKFDENFACSNESESLWHLVIALRRARVPALTNLWRARQQLTRITRTLCKILASSNTARHLFVQELDALYTFACVFYFLMFNRLNPKQRDRAVQILCRENPVHFDHCGQLTVRYRLSKSRAQIYWSKYITPILLM